MNSDRNIETMKSPPGDLGLEIKLARIDDLEEILAIQKIAFKQEAAIYQLCSIAPMNQTLEELIDECAKKTVLKLELNKAIIGSIRADETDGVCHLNKLVVLPEYQGMGYGKALLTEIEKYFPKAAKFALETGAKSINNIALYEKYGYQIVDRLVVHNGIEAVIMEKHKPSTL